MQGLGKARIISGFISKSMEWSNKVKSGTIYFKNKKTKKGEVTYPIGTHPDGIALGPTVRSFDYKVLFFLLHQLKAMPADISHQRKTRERASHFHIRCHFAQRRNSMMPRLRVELFLFSSSLVLYQELYINSHIHGTPDSIC